MDYAEGPEGCLKTVSSSPKSEPEPPRLSMWPRTLSARGHGRAPRKAPEKTGKEQPTFPGKVATLNSGTPCQWLRTATACSRPVCLSSSSMLFRQLWQTHRGISPRRFLTSFGMKSGGSFSPCNTSPFCEGPSSQPLRSR